MNSRPGFWASLWRALDERLGLGAFSYPVPSYANTLWYSLGALTLGAFVVLALTGFVLAQYYNPLPEQAPHSVRHIVQETRAGGVVRAFHFWAAQLMAVTVLLHMGRVFVTAAYRRPREANWVIGVLQLFVTLGLYFTGTVLKWDQEAYEAMLHNMEAARILGAVGVWFSEAFTRSVPILVRLYIAHVSILPAFLTLLAAAHFFLVKRHGISPSPWPQPDARPGMETFARHLRRVGAYSLVLLGALLVLAVARPPALGPAPVEGIEVTKPPWLFLPLYTLENLAGLPSLLYAPLGLALLLVLVPVLDGRGPIQLGARRPVLAVGLALALAVLAAGLWAWQSSLVAHVGR